MSREVMWESLEWPGHEHVVWADGGTEGSDSVMDSLAVLRPPEAPVPVRVACEIHADDRFRTRRVTVEVRESGKRRSLTLVSDGAGHWRDGQDRPLPELDGCVDVDITSTPLTNTLPIRRLRLEPGDVSDLTAAYIEVPELTVRPSAQRYTYVARDGGLGSVYRYESGAFSADLTIDADGLVVDYPGFWRRVGGG